MTTRESKVSFFRQSAWLVIATVGSGMFMAAVHPVVRRMPDGEYALFSSLLRVFLLMGISAGGLQTIFAQHSARACDESHHRELASITRRVFGATFMIWLVMGGLILAAGTGIQGVLTVTNSPAFLFTFMMGLSALWIPILKGLLQGRQHFAGFGWLLILDGVGRFAAIIVLVGWMHGSSGSAMAGVFFGQAVALGVGAWLTREVWMGAGAPVQWALWIRKVIPLTLGTAGILVVSNLDVLFVLKTFPAKELKAMRDLYNSAATIGMALAQFTTPLALVMFSKIARSQARAEKTDAMAVALAGTAVLGGAAALVSTVLPELPLRILYLTKTVKYLQAAPLVPWFVWSMLTFAMGVVLINNLLAREQYAVVPWLVAIAAGYAACLLSLRPVLLKMETIHAFRTIVQVLFAANLLILAVSWRCTGRFGWSTRLRPQPA